MANAIEELYPDRLEELSGLLATHWEQAREPLQAARWSARAATWAGRHHPNDALLHWRRVHALLRDLDEPEEVRGLRLAACLWILQLGWRLGLDEAEVERVFEEARGLAEKSGDKSSTALVYLAHGITVGMGGDHERALELSVRTRALAAEAGNRSVELSTGPSYWLYLAGRLHEAHADAEQVLSRYDGDVTIGREVLGFSAYIWALMWLGTILMPELGRVEEGRRLRAQALDLAQEHEDLELLGWVHTNWVNSAVASGEPEDALDHARKGVEIAERLGS